MLILIPLVLSGCAGISFQRIPVDFVNPATRLEIVEVDATEIEAQGVLLRLKQPEERTVRSTEEMALYVRIQEGLGSRMDFVKNRTDSYHPGERDDSYILLSESTFEKQPGKLVEAVEMTERGEVVRFIRGEHESKIGQFHIESWERTPLFPLGPVKIGDEWNYQETMAVRLKSFWVKQIDPSPYVIEAKSTLEGFARVGGVRCAVIRTEALQTKQEQLKIFFKDITLNIRAHIREWVYLDYEKGRVLVRVTTIDSQTTSPDLKIHDQGQSQAVSYLLQMQPQQAANI